jgi:hypothetical protein
MIITKTGKNQASIDNKWRLREFAILSQKSKKITDFSGFKLKSQGILSEPETTRYK